MSGLSKDQILAAFERINEELKARSLQGEICIFGGSAMVLAFSARVATKDVDAVFQPGSDIRAIARNVGEELALPADWLNDGVKGFLSERHEITSGNLPQYSNLRLTMPVPEYLLAMKCMAARMAAGAGDPDDVSDIKSLIRHLGLRSAKEVLDLVVRYYPPDRLTVKTQYLVEGLFEEGER